MLPWQPVYNRIIKPLKDVNGFLSFMKSNIAGCSLGLQQNYSACHGYDKYDSNFVSIESVWTTSLQSWFAKLCNENKRNEMSNFSDFWVLLCIYDSWVWWIISTFWRLYPCELLNTNSASCDVYYRIVGVYMVSLQIIWLQKAVFPTASFKSTVLYYNIGWRWHDNTELLCQSNFRFSHQYISFISGKGVSVKTIFTWRINESLIIWYKCVLINNWNRLWHVLLRFVFTAAWYLPWKFDKPISTGRLRAKNNWTTPHFNLGLSWQQWLDNRFIISNNGICWWQDRLDSWYIDISYSI